ncbi:MAG: glycosyltransferase [Eggerthellaceae bacterium]
MLEDFGALTRNAQIDSRYPAWFEKHRADEAVLRVQRETALEGAPVFSIVVPLYKTPRRFFDEMVQSVRAQTYARWELILVNASPEDEELAGAVRAASRSDERVKVVALEENGGISANSNAGIAAASGDFVCFFDHDDLIEPDLLYE